MVFERLSFRFGNCLIALAVNSASVVSCKIIAVSRACEQSCLNFARNAFVDSGSQNSEHTVGWSSVDSPCDSCIPQTLKASGSCFPSSSLSAAVAAVHAGFSVTRQSSASWMMT